MLRNKPRVVECDKRILQYNTLKCWRVSCSAARYLPESVLPFNSDLASKSQTSTVWGAAGLISEAMSAGNFPVHIGDSWVEHVISQPVHP